MTSNVIENGQTNELSDVNSLLLTFCETSVEQLYLKAANDLINEWKLNAPTLTRTSLQVQNQDQGYHGYSTTSTAISTAVEHANFENKIALLCKLTTKLTVDTDRELDTDEQKSILCATERVSKEICLDILSLCQENIHLCNECINFICLSSQLLSEQSISTLIEKLINTLQCYLNDWSGKHNSIENKCFSLVSCTSIITKFVVNTNKFKSIEKGLMTKLFEVCLEFTIYGDVAATGKILKSLHPLWQLIHQFESSKAFLDTIWQIVSRLDDIHGQKTFRFNKTELDSSTGKSYFILCGVADVIFDVHNGEDSLYLLKSNAFWEIIQQGFFNRDTLTRKRCLYILKRALDVLENYDVDIFSVHESSIFWWNHEAKLSAMKFWNDFILIMETLEEKQVHVIKPLLPRLHNLVTASSQTFQGSHMFHTSWVTTISQRIASHESTYIQRLGMMELLTIDLALFPVFQQGGEKFLVGPFISMFTETDVYHNPPDCPLGTCSPIADKLVTFLTGCYNTIGEDQRKQFFTSFIHGLTKESWSAAGLVYVTRALANIPHGHVWNRSVISCIRELLIKSVRTFEVHFRGAVQCYLVQAFLNLIDPNTISPSDLASLLSSIKLNETLKRGTTLWRKLVDWMSATCQNDDLKQWKAESLFEFVSTEISRLLSTKTAEASNKDCKPVSRMLLLICDSGIKHPDPEVSRTSPLSYSLSPVVQVLMSVNTHSYMARTKADWALVLLSTIAEECSSHTGDADEVTRTIKTTIDQCIEEILLFIDRNITELPSEIATFSVLVMYSKCLDVFSSHCDVTQCKHKQQIFNSCSSAWKTSSTKPTLSYQLQQYYSMLMLAFVCKQIEKHPQLPWKHNIYEVIRSIKPISCFQKPFDLNIEDSIGSGNQTSKGEWGKISNIYLSAQWQCIGHLLKHHPQYTGLYVESLTDSLDLVSGDTLSSVFGCIQWMLPKLEDEVCSHLLSLCWKKLLEESNGTRFIVTYASYCQVLLNTHTLSAAPEAKVHETLYEILDEIFTLGEEKKGLVNILCTMICNWCLLEPGYIESAVLHAGVIVRFILFGEIYSKHNRFNNEVHRYLLTLGDSLTVNEMIDNDAKDDNFVRVVALTLLVKLNPSDVGHQKFAWAIIEDLLKEQKVMACARVQHNFANSLIHRQKQRLFTALLLLYRFCQTIFTALLHTLTVEVQPSVRSLIEWLIVLSIRDNKGFLDKVWDEIRDGVDKKPMYVCSIMCVIHKLVKIQHDDWSVDNFLLEAIPIVLPWCMQSNFNTRSFAQACLLHMWDTAVENKLQGVLKTHSIVQDFVNFSYKNPKAAKVTKALPENFLFVFHPERDLSIQTLVQTIPMLNGLSDEEWLPLHQFIKLDNRWSSNEFYIPLYNTDDTLSQCKPEAWRIRNNDFEEDTVITDGDVQKKLIPWKSMLPEEDLDTNMYEEYTRKQLSSEGLVLVTSLIDKIPNLGGLCRTGEIFGVSEFVIGSLRYTEDKAFESLSVTAHKWLPIKEVRPEYLKDYLMEKKQEGYMLVGAEQTANSNCLSHYEFNQKTLLLLGNEKEGIPVELIQLLDVCVEIPQRGIIRSLNVHVSGALLIWEYTRQMMMKQECVAQCPE